MTAKNRSLAINLKSRRIPGIIVPIFCVFELEPEQTQNNVSSKQIKTFRKLKIDSQDHQNMSSLKAIQKLNKTKICFFIVLRCGSKSGGYNPGGTQHNSPTCRRKYLNFELRKKGKNTNLLVCYVLSNSKYVFLAFYFINQRPSAKIRAH